MEEEEEEEEDTGTGIGMGNSKRNRNRKRGIPLGMRGDREEFDGSFGGDLVTRGERRALSRVKRYGSFSHDQKSGWWCLFYYRRWDIITFSCFYRTA